MLSAKTRFAAAGAAALLLITVAWRAAEGQGAPSHAPPRSASNGSAGAFKVTFGLKQKFHGKSWAGVLPDPAQVRSIRGWRLDAEDRIIPPDRWEITLRTVANDTTEKAVILDVLTPPEQPVVMYFRDGNLSFKPSQVPWGEIFYIPEANGDVSVERIPESQTVTSAEYEDDDPALVRARDGSYWMAWVAYQTVSRSGYYIDGADRVMVARSRDGVLWSHPEPITPPGDHFRVALAQDARGRVWCVYALQKKLESGNFDLYARVFDGSSWSAEQQLTTDARPDVFHRLTSDRNGNLYLVWMAFRPQSDILMRVLTGDTWSNEINVSASPEDDWEPAVVTDKSGRVWIAWDAYRPTASAPATYDVLLRSYSAGALGELRTVSATPFAEMRADLAVDNADRVWIAWEEGGINWAKDYGWSSPKHRIHLRPGGSKIYGPPNSRTYLYRRPRVAVLANGRLEQPAADFAASYPPSLQPNLFQNPRLGVDGVGRVWLYLRHQFSAKGRNGGHLFDFYATTLRGDGSSQNWINPILLPGSTGRQDTVLATAPGANGGIVTAVVGDGRHLPVPLPVNHDITVSVLNTGAPAGAAPQLAAFVASRSADATVTHPREAEQVAQVRSHRLEAGGTKYKIVRGDLHRHSEISMDGSTDGSLWDFYRYALDAAAFDYVGLTDHNFGAWLDTDEPETKNTDDIYQWWRTQKSADIFYVRGRFVPLYGYERSINFPLGHRNIFHVRRGVFSLRVPKLYIAERRDLIEKDAQNLWSYLRETDGVGLPHTTGTSMGTNWQYRDDSLEPVTEIYQGDRNSYEEEGAPRAALPDSWGPGSGGRAPYQKGLVWNALGVGYKMGFIASSDHDSTHISYANLLVPDRVTTREDIQQALRSRHTYASTDNIVVDFQAGDALQGDEIAASASPVFNISVAGTEPILRIEVIKNNRVVYTKSLAKDASDPKRLAFTFQDNAFTDTEMRPSSQIKTWSHPETGIRPRPEAPESYYYVRVLQSFSPAKPDLEGEIAWSSPIYVRRQ